jgi:hypothetical protein
MKFQGFASPYTTPVPDEFFDLLLAEIDNLAELKVVLYVLRRTFGFGKLVDRISHSQFARGIKTTRGLTEVQLDRGTGLSRASVKTGLAKALSHGYLVRYIVCPHCDRQVSQLEDEHRQESTVKVPPRTCPHCERRLRGEAHYYYAPPLLSTELSTIGQDLAYPYLKSFTRGSEELIPALGQLLAPQETDKQETDNKKQNVVEALSAFGFKKQDSQTIAAEALQAGLTVRDVEAWIEYVHGQSGLTNPRGFLRSRLRTGQKPPARIQRGAARGSSAQRPSTEPDRYRYIRGRYADYIKH